MSIDAQIKQLLVDANNQPKGTVDFELMEDGLQLKITMRAPDGSGVWLGFYRESVDNMIKHLQHHVAKMK